MSKTTDRVGSSHELTRRFSYMSRIQKVIERIGKMISNNYEKETELVNKVSSISQYSAYSFQLSMGGLASLSQTLRLQLGSTPLAQYIHPILKTISAPFAWLYGIGSTLHGIIAISSLLRTYSLYNVLESNCLSKKEKITWIQDKYFQLKEKEVEKIQDYIEKKLPDLSKNQKKESFNRIATKILSCRFKSLEKRVSKSFATFIGEQLQTLIQDTNSPLTEIRQRGELSSNLLLQSISKQCRTQILVHLLGLGSIALTIVWSIVALLTASASFALIPIAIGAMVFDVMRMVIKYRVLNLEAEQAKARFQKIQEIKLPLEVVSAFPTWSQCTPKLC